jgi:hypothetical protein
MNYSFALGRCGDELLYTSIKGLLSFVENELVN